MKRNLSAMYELLRADGSIVINKNLLFELGINESIIYCELIAKYNYFNIREELTEDGFFFNTINDLYLSTGLGQKPQKASIKKLQDIKLIEYKVKGIPPKRYFKITDDTSIILGLIEKGRGKRDILKEKLLESTRTSKLRLMGVINNANTDKSNMPNGSVNNTKPNNTKPNNTKERYIILPNDDNVCFKIYKDAYTKKFNKVHMKVSANNYILLQEWVNSLAEAEVMVNEYREVVEDYFDNLPPSNNGNIVAFIKTSKRFFDVDIIESAI